MRDTIGKSVTEIAYYLYDCYKQRKGEYPAVSKPLDSA